jgi:drug/metabolite transporter (DMT)-like permease
MGIFISLLTALFGSLKDLLSKKVSFTLSGSLSAFASFLFALPFYALLLGVLWLIGKENFAFSWAFLWLVVLRSLTDAFAEWAKMSAFRFGDVSLVTCFLALVPFFLLISSPLITGDALSPLGIAAVLLTVCGSLSLVYEPSPENKGPRLKAILLAVLAAFLLSLNSCFDRLAVQIASPALSGCAMTLLSALLLLPSLLKHKTPLKEIRTESRALWGRGFFEVAFMVSKLSALQYMQAPYVTAIMQLSLLISVAGGRFIFKERHFLRRLLAAALILCGTVLIAVFVRK